MITNKIVVTDVNQHFIDGLPMEESGVLLKRMYDGSPITNVPWLVIDHSPTGFEWGFDGSGPADLALNILEHALWLLGLASASDTIRPNNEDDHFPFQKAVFKCFNGRCMGDAWKMHQKLKKEIMVNMDVAGGFIPWEWIVEFIYSFLNLPVPENWYDTADITYCFIPAGFLEAYFNNADQRLRNAKINANIDRGMSASAFCSKIAETILGEGERHEAHVFIYGDDAEIPEMIMFDENLNLTKSNMLYKSVVRQFQLLSEAPQSWTIMIKGEK